MREKTLFRWGCGRPPFASLITAAAAAISFPLFIPRGREQIEFAFEWSFQSAAEDGGKASTSVLLQLGEKRRREGGLITNAEGIADGM